MDEAPIHRPIRRTGSVSILVGQAVPIGEDSKVAPEPAGRGDSAQARVRAIRTISSGAAIFTAGVFTLLILGMPGSGIGWHEAAGALMLGLIAIALSAAVQLRSSEPGPYHRILGALAALLGTGAAGFALAIGSVPQELSVIPLFGIIVLGALLADSIRVGVRA